jgi:hypothetical protein
MANLRIPAVTLEVNKIEQWSSIIPQIRNRTVKTQNYTNNRPISGMVHCLKYTVFDISDVSGVDSTPVFRWLIVTTLTDQCRQPETSPETSAFMASTLTTIPSATVAAKGSAHCACSTLQCDGTELQRYQLQQRPCCVRVISVGRYIHTYTNNIGLFFPYELLKAG